MTTQHNVWLPCTHPHHSPNVPLSTSHCNNSTHSSTHTFFVSWNVGWQFLYSCLLLDIVLYLVLVPKTDLASCNAWQYMAVAHPKAWGSVWTQCLHSRESCAAVKNRHASSWPCAHRVSRAVSVSRVTGHLVGLVSLSQDYKLSLGSLFLFIFLVRFNFLV